MNSTPHSAAARARTDAQTSHRDGTSCIREPRPMGRRAQLIRRVRALSRRRLEYRFQDSRRSRRRVDETERPRRTASRRGTMEPGSGIREIETETAHPTDASSVVSPELGAPTAIERALRLTGWIRSHRIALGVGVFFAYAVVGLIANLPTYPWDPNRIATCACGGGKDPAQTVWFLAWTPFALLHGRNFYVTTWLNYPVGVNLAAEHDHADARVAHDADHARVERHRERERAALARIPSFCELDVLRRRVSQPPPPGGVRCWCLLRVLALHDRPILDTPQSRVRTAPPFDLLVYLRNRSESIFFGCGLGCPPRSVRDCGVLRESRSAVDHRALRRDRAVVLALFHPRQSLRHIPYTLLGLAIGVAIAYACCFNAVRVMEHGALHYIGPPYPPGARYDANLLGPISPTSWQLLTPASLADFGSKLVGGSTNVDENGSYLGIPLLLLLGYFLIRYRRSRWLQFSTLLAVLNFVLSLGQKLHVGSTIYDVHLPFSWLTRWPIMRDVVPARYLGTRHVLRRVCARGGHNGAARSVHDISIGRGHGRRAGSMGWTKGGAHRRMGTRRTRHLEPAPELAILLATSPRFGRALGIVPIGDLEGERCSHVPVRGARYGRRDGVAGRGQDAVQTRRKLRVAPRTRFAFNSTANRPSALRCRRDIRQRARTESGPHPRRSVPRACDGLGDRSPRRRRTGFAGECRRIGCCAEREPRRSALSSSPTRRTTSSKWASPRSPTSASGRGSRRGPPRRREASTSSSTAPSGPPRSARDASHNCGRSSS